MATTPTESDRLPIQKTYKLFINGAFVRTESGRVYKVLNRKGALLANACQASRKDLRDAVVAARHRAAPWQGVNAYLRSQMLYRMAEMLEGRRASFVDVRRALGDTPRRAAATVDQSIDRIIYYAGWCDKIVQVFGAINPVATSHYNFSSLEPMGVVAVQAPQGGGLTGLVDTTLPALAGGNTVVALADHADPLTAMLLAEVAHDSDIPPGVFNVLTGYGDEIAPHMARHKDINALVVDPDFDGADACRKDAAINIKRVIDGAADRRRAPSAYRVSELMETKTTWHPSGA